MILNSVYCRRSSCAFDIGPCLVEVQRDLEVHPEFRGGVKDATHEDSCFCGHVPLSVDESVDPLDRHTHPLSKLNLGHLQRTEELAEKYLPGVSRLSFSGSHLTHLSVVVRNPNVCGSAVRPPEYDSELIVYPYAMELSQPAPELLEPITRRSFEIL